MTVKRATKRPPAKPAPAKARKPPPTSARAAPEKNSTLLKNAGDKPARYKPPRAGIGRMKGVPNAITKTTREIIQAVIDGNASKVQGWLDRVATKNPAKAVSLFAKLAEYVIPKLQRTELSGHVTGLVKEVPAWEDVSPEEASRMYQEMIMGGKEGRPKVTLKHLPSVKPYVAPPRPEAVAVPRPRPKVEVLRPAGLPLPEDVPHGTRAQDVEEAEFSPSHSGECTPIVDSACCFCRQLWAKNLEAAQDEALRAQRPPQVIT